MNLSALDALLVSDAQLDDRACVRLLFAATRNHPLHRCLFSHLGAQDELFEERLDGWRRLLRDPAAKSVLSSFRPFAVWSYPFALAQYFLASSYRVIGLCGAPGAGKTTLASAMAECMRMMRPGCGVTMLSLDKFYYPPEERRRRGLQWRAQPGSHDLAAAQRALQEVELRGSYDKIIFEGWFAGKMDEGYDSFSRYLEFLIYLDCPTHLAKHRRFEREEHLRESAAHQEVYSQAELEQFWNMLLEPGIRNWVLPLRDAADLVMVLDDSGDLADARLAVRDGPDAAA
jgi:hypothetical protein